MPIPLASINVNWAV